MVRDGKVPSDWSKARPRQVDREGRWTVERGRKPSPAPDNTKPRMAAEITIPMFGYKNYVVIDRPHRFICLLVVMHAARHYGSQLGAVLDPQNTASDVWAGTAYHSRANLTTLLRRGLSPRFQRQRGAQKDC